MKKRLFSILAIAAMLMTCLCTAGIEPAFAEEEVDNTGFVIEDYLVEVQVHDNNSMDIREVIQVDFSQYKHGIYRNIPTRLAITADNKRYEYSCAVKDVRVKGHEAKFVDAEGSDKVVRIGDPDRTIIGKETYELSYRYIYPDDRIDSFDFMYHNLLGAQWPVPIKHFEFDVKFDKAIPADSLKDMQIFSGYSNAQGNDLNVLFVSEEKELSGHCWDIYPQQAITMRYVLPEGYFTGEKTRSLIPSIIGLVILAAGLLLTVIKVLGTKRKKPVPTVEFKAPDDMPPAEAGTIIDETADTKDVMSLIPWFGEKGYLKAEVIEVPKRFGKTKKVIQLTKTGVLPVEAPVYQHELFNLLFEEGPVRVMDDLSESFGKKFNEVASKLNAVFQGERKLSTGTGTAWLLGFIIALGAGVFYGFASCVSWMDSIMPGVMALCFFGVNLCTCITVKTGKYKVLGPIMSVVSLAIELLMVFLFLGGGNSLFPMALLLAVFAVAAVGSFFAAFVIAPTDYKLEMQGKLLGLKEFIKTAEQDRLNMLIEENPNYFFDVLPFAMVFGLEEIWSKMFENIKIKSPEWYNDRYSGGAFSTVAFCNMMNDGVNSSISSAVSSANSSGGGGGAGGGGGGGGGGSW